MQINICLNGNIIQLLKDNKIGTSIIEKHKEKEKEKFCIIKQLIIYLVRIHIF